MGSTSITICPVCEKRFIPSVYWVYKKEAHKPNGYKITYYCSYHCFRESGGGKEKFKNQPKKRGKRYE